MSEETPIIILSSERSESNLLRVLFGNHSNVSAPVSPQLCHVFSRVLEHYGDLRERRNAERLMRHMITFSAHEFSGWTLAADAGHLYETFSPRSFLECVHAVYMANARHEGKATFCSKENDLHLFAPAWSREFPKSRYIHLFRDPRDCAASWKKRPQFYSSTVFLSASRWVQEQKSFIALSNAFDLPVCQVSYEQLIQNPRSEMSRLLEFCELDVEETCFNSDPAKNKEAAVSPYWENLAKPIMMDNSRKYQKQLTSEEILIAESLCAEIMIRLGYSLETEADWAPGCFHRRYHRIQKKRAEKKHRQKTADFMDRHIKSRQELLKKLLSDAMPNQ